MQPVHSPFTILVDHREKAPYLFQGLLADANKQDRPLIIPVKYVHLKTGDYSIEGMEDMVTIERKSLSDLYSTLGSHRERFEREHVRMAAMEFAAVVFESSWADAVVHPPERSQLHPRTVFRTGMSWAQRYGVHWIPAGDRHGGEIMTYQLLRFFWRDKEKLRKAKLKAESGKQMLRRESSDF
jgi:ERCC4-type nuclease